MNTLKTRPNGPSPFFRGAEFWSWLLWIAYTGLVIRGAVLSASKIPRWLLHFNDKQIHAAEFFLLFWFTLNAFRKIKSLRFSKLLMFVLAYCSFMGILTEMLQIWAPSRSAEIADLIADAFGFSFAAVLFNLFRKKA